MLRPIHIGIDAGGSKTEILAESGSDSLHQTGDGVNLQRDGLDRSTRVLARLIDAALDAVAHDHAGSIYLGVAGAGRPEDQRGLAEHLSDRLGSRIDSYALTVGHDARIALEAALEGESGMVVIVGTGSVALARTETGAIERAGGWGPRIGDDGSGTALGVAGLRAVAAAFDGGAPTTLGRRLAEHFGIDSPESLVRTVYAGAWAVQTLAPLVVAEAEAGDWVCTRILKRQANAIAQRAGWLAARADETAPRIALMGGLANEAYYRACLTEALQRHLPGWRIVYPSRRPVYGALALARKHAAEQPRHEIDSGG